MRGQAGTQSKYRSVGTGGTQTHHHSPASLLLLFFHDKDASGPVAVRLKRSLKSRQKESFNSYACRHLQVKTSSKKVIFFFKTSIKWSCSQWKCGRLMKPLWCLETGRITAADDWIDLWSWYWWRRFECACHIIFTFSLFTRQSKNITHFPSHGTSQ